MTLMKSPPALESRVEARTALVGVESSHGHEHTHLSGLTHAAHLLARYLLTDLTFSDWDRSAHGSLDDFPRSSMQPAPPEPSSGDTGPLDADRPLWERRAARP